MDSKGRWLDMGDKPVTYPSFREEYLWHTGIVFKLCTEAADVFLDTAVVVSVFQAPYLFQKCAVRKHPAVISCQFGEQMILDRSQFDSLAGKEYLACAEIDR